MCQVFLYQSNTKKDIFTYHFLEIYINGLTCFFLQKLEDNYFINQVYNFQVSSTFVAIWLYHSGPTSNPNGGSCSGICGAYALLTCGSNVYVTPPLSHLIWYSHKQLKSSSVRLRIRLIIRISILDDLIDLEKLINVYYIVKKINNKQLN